MILDVTFDVTALARKPRASGDDPAALLAEIGDLK